MKKMIDQNGLCSWFWCMIGFIILVQEPLQAQEAKPQEGPAVIQILWNKPKDSIKMATNEMLLYSLIARGTDSLPGANFRQASRERSVLWNTHICPEVLVLRVQFHPDELPFVQKQLDALLFQSQPVMGVMESWKKELLYGYNYYKNDADSLLKWTVNGQLQLYKTLEKTNETDSSALIKVLGFPIDYQSVGILNSSYIPKKITAYIDPDDHVVPRVYKASRLHIPRQTSLKYQAFQLQHRSPIELFRYYLAFKMMQQYDINSIDLRLEENRLLIFLKEEKSLDLSEEKLHQLNALISTENATIRYLLWQSKNQNQALAISLQRLGLWSMEDEGSELPIVTEYRMGK